MRLSSGGLRILDVSEIQDRKADPKVKVVANLDWPEGSLPQVAEPFTKKGRHYLLEVDEFADFGLDGGPTHGLGTRGRRPDHRHRGPDHSRRSSRTCGSRSTSPAPAPATSSSTPAR